MRTARLLFAILLTFGCLAVRADELHLKDGSKLIGTIVGYQGSAFRVKTSYGYALVERSSVASITVTPNSPSSEKKSGTEEKSAAKVSAREQDPKDPHAKSGEDESAASHKSAPSNSATASNGANVSAASHEPQPAPSNQTAASSVPASAAAANATANPAAPNAAPASAPTPMRERVLDNSYVNDTYGFQIYRPPDWQVIQGARAALPGSVAALGTSDQSTYLIIGIEPADDTLLAHVTVTNDRLADSFDNFRPSALRQTLIGGFPACEYQFEGMAENQLWAGTVALVRHGQDTFTIFGVTTAKSDLVQIQQNVIPRAIASLQFTTAQAK